MKIKRILSAITAAVLAVSLAACGGNGGGTSDNAGGGASDNGGNAGSSGSSIYRTLDDIKTAGSLKIGVFSDKNPFGYIDNNGEYQGYDVYFAK